MRKSLDEADNSRFNPLNVVHLSNTEPFVCFTAWSSGQWWAYTPPHKTDEFMDHTHTCGSAVGRAQGQLRLTLRARLKSVGVNFYHRASGSHELVSTLCSYNTSKKQQWIINVLATVSAGSGYDTSFILLCKMLQYKFAGKNELMFPPLANIHLPPTGIR